MGSDELIAGRYQLLAKLGSGGQGEVWRARDVELNRVVAMKRSSAADREQGQRQTRREAVQGAALTHPNVIMVLTSFTAGADHWVVSEYLESRDLAKVVEQDGTLFPERAARIGEQVAAALVAIHRAGIVHLDVKPANVLVTATGQAKLTDLGIARWAEETDVSGGVLDCTPAYVAPEVANREVGTSAADVFALGATVFAAVEGRSPWGRLDAPPQSMLARAGAGQREPHRQGGPLGKVLDALLHKDPRRRPSAEDAQAMLAEVASGAKLTLRVPPPPPRRRWPVYTALGAVLAVAAAAAVFWPWADSLPEDRLRLLGDPRTVDPCALTEVGALSRFGQAVLDQDYGNFNRCRVLVRMKPDDPADEVSVQVQLQGFPGTNTPTPTATVIAPIHRPAQRGDECERTVHLPDGYRIRIRAEHLRDRPAPLCDMAETLTTGVLQVLTQGQVKRRPTEAPENSLVRLEACTLVTRAELSPLIGAAEADPGFGDWDCEWVRGRREVKVEFDRRPPLAEKKGGRRVDLGAGVEGVVDPDRESCQVVIPHRPMSDSAGRPMLEVVRLHLRDAQPGETLCQPLIELAKAVAGRLPRIS
ncbi:MULTISPECIES: serine/threonine-protein kinase [unclassified Crossiella]|uniref:serine/threonine-protein kinase n=1 Tax=unclassified Crossiella TaxID=2620835 RepID=UPI001FFF7611|nr:MULTISPECIES: serine/threonine-protein kinase [unclassified Crossiella]MCK2242904.1 serine/threonine protein kinase [Crossiella sp. S99.2]MCK2256781.1 serine/threonine protein kinase [Crossiella sp. S99.1]